MWWVAVEVSIKKKKSEIRTSLGGPVVKNPPCKAGDLRLIPGRKTKNPHATEQLSLHAATAEALELWTSSHN